MRYLFMTLFAVSLGLNVWLSHNNHELLKENLALHAEVQDHVEEKDEILTTLEWKHERIEELATIIKDLRPDMPFQERERLAEIFVDAGEEYDINPELLIQIAWVESRIGKYNVSHAGALGIMQVMPTVWVEKINFVSDRQHLLVPEVNIRAGAYVLRKYLDWACNDHKLALLAYNRGPRRVLNLMRRNEDPSNGYARDVLSVEA